MTNQTQTHTDAISDAINTDFWTVELDRDTISVAAPVGDWYFEIVVNDDTFNLAYAGENTSDPEGLGFEDFDELIEQLAERVQMHTDEYIAQVNDDLRTGEPTNDAEAVNALVYQPDDVAWDESFARYAIAQHRRQHVAMSYDDPVTDKDTEIVQEFLAHTTEQNLHAISENVQLDEITTLNALYALERKGVVNVSERAGEMKFRVRVGYWAGFDKTAQPDTDTYHAL